MDRSKDGIYFTIKLEKGLLDLEMSIVKDGELVFPPLKLSPNEKYTRKFFELFYDVLNQADIAGGHKNRIIKFLEGGMDEFLSDGE